MKKRFLISFLTSFLIFGFWHFQNRTQGAGQKDTSFARSNDENVSIKTNEISEMKKTNTNEVQESGFMLDQKEVVKKVLVSDPKAEALILNSLKKYLGDLKSSNRESSLKILMEYPLEGMRVLQNVLNYASFNEPNHRVQLLSLGIDLLDQVNHDLLVLDRESLTGNEIHKMAEQIVKHEITAPEWVPFLAANKSTKATLDNLEHSGEIYNKNGQWVKPTLPARVMALQLAARLPLSQQAEVYRYVFELTDGSRSYETLLLASQDLLKK